MLKAKTPQELEQLRKRFKLFFTETRYAVYDKEQNVMKTYVKSNDITLRISPDETFVISRFALAAWSTRFYLISDVFGVQNAITMARINGYEGHDPRELEKYL